MLDDPEVKTLKKEVNIIKNKIQNLNKSLELYEGSDDNLINKND